jgi:hypothetical protein
MTDILFRSIEKAYVQKRNSMKKLTILLTFILCAMSVHGELKQFDRTISVELANNTLYISGNNMNYERPVSYSATIVNTSVIVVLDEFQRDLTMEWVENVTSETDSQLIYMTSCIRNLTDTMSQVNSNVNYYDKYVTCVSDKEACNAWKTSTGDVQLKLDKCNTDFSEKTIGLNDMTAKKDSCDLALTSCNTERTDLKSQANFHWFVHIVSGLIIIFMYFKIKPINKMQKHPVQDDVSKDMDKLM